MAQAGESRLNPNLDMSREELGRTVGAPGGGLTCVCVRARVFMCLELILSVVFHNCKLEKTNDCQMNFSLVME